MPSYNYTIRSSYQPLSMQEALTPFVMYKEAAEKTESEYDRLDQETDKFKYLADLETDSKAKDIYNNYVQELQKHSEDFSRNGLTMENRNALRGLRRRFQGEIGMLADARNALEKELDLRRNMSAKDSSMLYGNNNLSIDDFLYGNRPDLYSVSGNELYTKGANAGKNASSRIFSSGDAGKVLNGYYVDYVQRMGYTPEQLQQFGAQISEDFYKTVDTLPELQQAAMQILEANGVTEHLGDADLRKAQQQVIRGIIDGAVYTEQHSPQRDLGKMTAVESAKEARAKADESRAVEDWERTKRERDALFNIRFRPKVDDNGKPVVDSKGNQVYELNPDYINYNGYKVDPNTGKLRENSNRSSQVEEEINKVDSALLSLNKNPGVFGHNEGFQVTVDNEVRHYGWIGAIDSHKGTLRHGKIGDDVPGAGYGFTSASNVMSPWGNYSAESINKDERDKVKLLARNEMQSLLYTIGRDGKPYPTDLGKVVENMVDSYKKEHNIPEDDYLDIQLIQVPNEHGGKRNGYLLAVRNQ